MRILNGKEIASLTAGWLRVTEEHGYFCFHRFTEQQEYFYEELDSLRFTECYTTAGVRFDFVTDSESFGFDYELHSASGGPAYYFDAFIDGKFFARMGEEKRSACRSALDLKLPAGKKRLTLWLPYWTVVFIKNVRLDEDCFFEGVPYERTLLTIGDSITHGSRADYPGCTYPALLAARLGWNVINQGLGNDTYHGGSLGEGIGFTPDCITVLLGTNDWSRRKKEKFDRCVREFYEKLSAIYPDSAIIAVTPLWRGDGDLRVTEAGTFGYVADSVREAAKICPRATVLEGRELLPHEGKYYASDMLHLSREGFDRLADALIPAIRSSLKGKEKS